MPRKNRPKRPFWKIVFESLRGMFPKPTELVTMLVISAVFMVVLFFAVQPDSAYEVVALIAGPAAAFLWYCSAWAPLDANNEFRALEGTTEAELRMSAARRVIAHRAEIWTALLSGGAAAFALVAVATSTLGHKWVYVVGGFSFLALLIAPAIRDIVTCERSIATLLDIERLALRRRIGFEAAGAELAALGKTEAKRVDIVLGGRSLRTKREIALADILDARSVLAEREDAL
jgi:hypothetical protein